ncbi:MAG: DUF2279 domain-containing protein [Flavipsychrobacter sp.]
MNRYSHFLLCLLAVILVAPATAQEEKKKDHTQRNRLILVGTLHAASMGFTFYGLNKAWYEDYPRSSFHTRNDIGVWNQVDKLGHAYSGYAVAGILTDVYSWTGVRKKKAVLIGSTSSLAFLSIIEFLDGHSSEWGFSYGDMGANVAGVALFAGQELLWKEQRIQFKFSYHNKSYDPTYQYVTRQRFGKGQGERILKDYNAQTYWLSVGVHQFGVSWWPKWLNVALGYGANQMYGAYNNSWTDENGVGVNANNIPRERQFYISPDINLSVINTKSGLLNAIFDRLYIKIPSPALEINTETGLHFHPIYF